MQFVDDSEALGTLPVSTLRTTLRAEVGIIMHRLDRSFQAQRFVDKFHFRQKEKVELLLQNESWNLVGFVTTCVGVKPFQATVPAEFHQLIAQIEVRPSGSERASGDEAFDINGVVVKPVGSLLM